MSVINTREPAPMMLYSSYHKPTAPRDLMRVVDEMAAIIQDWLAKEGNNITHLVCTGTSGQSVAWPLSYKLGIPVCVVRKPDEKAHSGSIVGQGELGNYAIVDDFIASGDTLARIVTTLDEEANTSTNVVLGLTPRPTPKAVFLYDSTRTADWTRGDLAVPVMSNPNSDN